MDVQDDDLLYGVPSIAKAFKMKPEQIHHLKKRHGFPTFKIGRIVCARPSAIREWIAAREAAGVRHV